MEKEKQEIKFEEKVSELEKIIGELENGNVDLEDSIEKYAYAMQLAKECDDKLKQIEERVNKIVAENGTVEDFDLME
ncbi:MAG: exodeoxyribonuclease VII small subunit [Bacilli bacterium]|nr:exodeoxyribonuclease VII small subunit [Bacilli bacterium]